MRLTVGNELIFAQDFGEEFKDWAADGALSSIGAIVVVLVVIAVVLMAVSRN